MKVMHVPGFSLLEFLVYNTLFCFLVLLGTIIMTRTCMAIKMQEGQEQAMLDTSLVHDLFARNIYYAPTDKQLWKHISDHAIIWHDIKSKSDKGWCWQQQCLYMIEGRYDKENQRWLSARKSLVAQHIPKAQFLVHEYKSAIPPCGIKALSLIISSLHRDDQEFYVGIRTRQSL